MIDPTTNAPAKSSGDRVGADIKHELAASNPLLTRQMEQFAARMANLAAEPERVRAEAAALAKQYGHVPS